MSLGHAALYVPHVALAGHFGLSSEWDRISYSTARVPKLGSGPLEVALGEKCANCTYSKTLNNIWFHTIQPFHKLVIRVRTVLTCTGTLKQAV